MPVPAGELSIYRGGAGLAAATVELGSGGVRFVTDCRCNGR